MSRHIVTAFDADLLAISSRIAEMGGLAEEQLGSAIEALQTRDSELAAEVIQSDKRLDRMEADAREDRRRGHGAAPARWRRTCAR